MVLPGGLTTINASDLVPDGSVVHEVQIQAAPNSELWAIDIRIWLAIVHSESPTVAEVEAGMRIVDWRYAKAGKLWMAICSPTNERYVLRKVLHGSHMRFAYNADTTHVGGGVCRVSVLYSPG